MGISGCLKSIERVWEPLRIQVDLPADAVPLLKSKICKAREMVHWPCTATVVLQAPPAETALDSQQLTKLILTLY